METRSRYAEAALGAIVIVVVALFVWLSIIVGGGAPSNSVRYSLVFDSALGLNADNTVAIAGVKVGVVDSIGIEGRNAKVVVAIEPGVKLFENGFGAVRAKTLLGEKYIDLDPGAPPSASVPPGGTLAKNTPTVEIDNLIRSAAKLVDSLNVITPPFESAMASLGEVLQETKGEDLGDALTSTVAETGSLISELRALIAGSQDDFQALLALSRERGPGLLSQLEGTTRRFDDLLAAVDPKAINRVMTKIDPAMENMDAAVSDLRLAMTDVRKASGRLDTILARVDRTLARGEGINERSIREFLQVEGVRVNLIPDARVERRLRKLRNESTPLPVP